jgi:hypothetical protein
MIVGSVTEVQRAVLHYHVNKAIRHQDLISCSMAAGDANYPILRPTESLVMPRFNSGLRDGIDLKIEIADLIYVSKVIFESHVDTVLMPTVDSCRTLEGYGKSANLFCNSYSVHCIEEIVKQLVCHRGIVLTYLPRAFHIFRALDVLPFSVLTKVRKKQRRR